VTLLAPGGGPAAPPGSMAAVACEDISYSFGTHTAVRRVDLRIEPGETFGLLGPNGAGKTTTIRMLVTLLKPLSGRITVFGADTAARPMLVRRMIGYVPQLLSADGDPDRMGERPAVRAAVRRPAPGAGRAGRRRARGDGPGGRGAPPRRHLLRRDDPPPGTRAGAGQRTAAARAR